MDKRILEIVNNKEGQNCVGKTVKSFVSEDSELILTFHDGSTLEIESNLFSHQVLFLNKEAR